MTLREKTESIFTDVQLPFTNGVEPLFPSGTSDAMRDPAVVVVSAHMDLRDRGARAGQAGVTPWAGQTFEAEDLQEVVLSVHDPQWPPTAGLQATGGC